MQAPPPPSIPTGETATKPDPTLKPSYDAKVSGKTLKLYMKLPKRFFDPQRQNSELANIGSDRDTIVTAQTETTSMIYKHYGDEDNIWSSPKLCIFHLKQKMKLISSLSGVMAVTNCTQSECECGCLYCYIRVLQLE